MDAHDAEVSHYNSQRALADKGFRIPFRGTAHEELHNQLVKHRCTMKSETHYSPYCALVQSSGVGKTRALMELSKLGVYVCYCSLASHSSTAFPPRTGGLADKLANTFTEHGMVFYLKAWLSILAAHISTTSPEVWKQDQLPDEHGSHEGGLAKKILKEWMKSDLDDTYKGKNPDAWSIDTCSEVIKSVEKALQKKCTQCSPGEKEACIHTPCSVVFAFDEARGLQIKHPGSTSMTFSPFYQIRRALRMFFGHQTFSAIMLDTSAKVTKLLPSKHDEDSERAKSMGFKLAPPIYSLPNMSLFKETASHGVPDCFQPEHWLKQGRPMWSARLEMGDCPSSVRQFALQKLVRTVAGPFARGIDVNVRLGVMTESQAMALLSASAGLSICARSELAEAMAASHMHLILRVSEDRSMIYIGLPAEPILAEGAASALQNDVVQEGALKHLLAACMAGYVTPGPRGEFVAKFILVAATWDAGERWQLRQIPVEKYLEKLLVNGNADQTTFDALKAKCPEGGSVFFNSFVLVRKPPTTDTLHRAFVSGYALMYRAENNLPGTDMIIPVWTSNGMTCIVVSVMNLNRPGWLEDVSTKKIRSEFTNVRVEPGLFDITIVMSLREPVKDLGDGSAWRLWVSTEGHVATDMDPHINLSCYGIDRNFSYLTENVKKLLKEVLITVPDELAGATDIEKEWIKGLLPEEYI
ncbi:hypothetical protein GOP47_0003487 [Adiantum capillus-veneris]|uniref:Uncharacterized protein n=1 Tax=Adiantum capillus-veneris TaxID=13818 RepID=A0A9D4VCC1_ADICA|nr:hypothetical protein GOP47_0003487 [Adiantum capillus-veneris]